MMDANIPYSFPALYEELGTDGDKMREKSMSVCSTDTAIILAQRRRKRAIELLLADKRDLNVLKNSNILGIACTAALLTTATKKSGRHKCFVAAASQDHVSVHSLFLTPGLRTRLEEDTLCSHLVMRSIQEACAAATAAADSTGSVSVGLEAAAAVAAATVTEEEEGEGEGEGEGVLASLLYGDSMDSLSSHHVLEAAQGVHSVCARLQGKQAGHALFHLKNSSDEPGSTAAAAADDEDEDFMCFEDVKIPAGALLYSGSYNPLHRGHTQLAAAALRKRGYTVVRDSDGALVNDLGELHPPVIFEISAVNADKPPLETEELLDRVRGVLTSPLLQESGLLNTCVSVTSEPLFLEKAALFPGCDFLVGADTMTRLLSPRYYGDKQQLAELRGSGDGGSGGGGGSHYPPNGGIGGYSYPPGGGGGASLADTVATHSMVAALSQIRERGCSFIVGGRITSPPPSSSSSSSSSSSAAAAAAPSTTTAAAAAAKTEGKVGAQQGGLFVGCDEVLRSGLCASLPRDVVGMFEGLSEGEFRMDLSSTELRRAAETRE
jgi:hypothetical protein